MQFPNNFLLGFVSFRQSRLSIGTHKSILASLCLKINYFPCSILIFYSLIILFQYILYTLHIFIFFY